MVVCSRENRSAGGCKRLSGARVVSYSPKECPRVFPLPLERQVRLSEKGNLTMIGAERFFVERAAGDRAHECEIAKAMVEDVSEQFASSAGSGRPCSVAKLPFEPYGNGSR